MHVSGNAWLLAAIAIPLTILTVVIWWLWAHGSICRAIKYLLAFRSKEQLPDMEKGSAPQPSQAKDFCPQIAPHQICNSRVASSMTAVSCGYFSKI
jgi:hypothetical protein